MQHSIHCHFFKTATSCFSTASVSIPLVDLIHTSIMPGVPSILPWMRTGVEGMKVAAAMASLPGGEGRGRKKSQGWEGKGRN